MESKVTRVAMFGALLFMSLGLLSLFSQRAENRETIENLKAQVESWKATAEAGVAEERVDKKVIALMGKILDDPMFQEIVLAHVRARHERLVDEMTDEEREAFKADPFGGRWVQLIRSGEASKAAVELDRDYVGRDRSGDDI